MKGASPHSIGSVDFDCRVRRLYKALVEKSGVPQDVAFREQVEPLSLDVVIDALCRGFGVDKEYLHVRQRGCMIRPVAAYLLCKFTGMTQRAVAGELNLNSGAAAGGQIRKLFRVLTEDENLKRKVEKITAGLEDKRKK